MKSQITNHKSQISFKKQNSKFLGFGTWDLGFTLIELVVAIGILSILAGFLILVINPLDQFKKANDARRKADLGQVQKSLEEYYQDNGTYPQSSVNYQIENISLTPIPWGSSWSPYIDVLPSDPNAGQKYVYYTDNQQRYWLYSSLERGAKDTESCNNGDACSAFSSTFTGINSPLPPVSSDCGSTCNYGVSSPNTSP